jgi:hypothetical protein
MVLFDWLCSGDSFGNSDSFDGDGIGMNTSDEDNYPYN